MRTPPGVAFTRAHPYDVLFGRWSVGVAMAVVLGAVAGVVVIRPEALGIELCWIRRLSGIPCPGCGLTRAVCRLAAGQVGEAVRLHPFAFLVLPYALLAASSPLWPRALRARVRQSLEHYRSGFELAYGSLVLGFVAFGGLRAVGVTLGLLPTA